MAYAVCASLFQVGTRKQYEAVRSRAVHPGKRQSWPKRARSFPPPPARRRVAGQSWLCTTSKRKLGNSFSRRHFLDAPKCKKGNPQVGFRRATRRKQPSKSKILRR